MVWDASKSPGDLITSSDWNDMVTDQKNHASRHSDGGSDELDAADLAGGAGTNGQLLQTDGSAASWVDFQSGSDVSDDGTLVVAAPTDVNYANALNVTDDGDGSVTVDVGTGSIQTDEIDLSISPTWTGSHTFNNAIVKPQDSGASTLANMSVSSTPSQGTEQSIGINIDGSRIFKAYAEADGAGGVQQTALDMSTNKIQNVGLIDGVDITSHASRHSDGGADELDAADLAGGLGNNGQFLQTDGSAASWASPPSSNRESLRFGAEGASTTSETYVTIENSDLTIDFDNYKDNGAVDIDLFYHIHNPADFCKASTDTEQDISSSITDKIAGLYYREDDSSIWVCDQDSAIVREFDDTNYNLQNSYDISSEYDSPLGIWWDSGNSEWIIVGDDSNNDAYVNRYSSDFSTLNSENNIESDIDGFNGGEAGVLTYDSSQSLYYILDRDAGNVYEFDSSFNLQNTYSLDTTNLSTGIGAVYPLEYDSGRDQFLVADSDHDRIRVFDKSFNDTGEVGNFGSELSDAVGGIHYKNNGNLLLGGQVGVLRPVYGDDGGVDARVMRQNSGNAITGSEVGASSANVWKYVEATGISLDNESGFESYQIDLKTQNNYGKAQYNSVVMKIYPGGK